MENFSYRPELSRKDIEFKPQNINNLKEKVDGSFKNRVTKIGTFLKYPDYFKISDQDKEFFSEQKFEKDTAYLRRKKELIEQHPLTQNERETLQLSKALESFLIDQLPKILNTNAITHPTIDYVDSAQGSDIILESPGIEDYLSIDVTLGAGSNYKLAETSEIYSKGELYKADYFVGKGNNLTKIDSMPHVVLGLGRKHFDEAMLGWLKGESISPETAKIVLSEAITQLRVYSKFFESESKPEIAERFDKFTELFETSLQELNKTVPTSTVPNHDQVQEMIENSLLQNYHSSVTEAAQPQVESRTPRTGRVIKIARPAKK